MKKNLTISMILFFLGLIIINMAVFAEEIGLDKNPGNWGEVRISMLIFGVFVILCAGAYYRYIDQFNPIVQTFYGRFLSWMDAHQSSANLLRLFRMYRFTLPIVLFVIVTYIWFISSGTWTNWISPTRYYADLARGFQRGQLFIPTQPDPRLSELPNPYDPIARVGIDVLPDITFYNGRYYLYWGPVPALILLAVQSLYHGRVGDLQLVFGFVCGIFLMQFFILIFVWDRFFNRHPKWMLALSILIAGVASPITFMLNNFRGARIYEAAISGGQFFFMGGVLFILTSLGSKSPAGWRLSLAGIFFALAIGTRLFLFIPVGVLTALTAFWIFKSNTDLSRKVINLFLLVFPVVLGLACLGWYNWARFGSITESGLYYQLAGNYIQENYPELIKPIYIYQNLYNYLMNPFRFDKQFPFTYVEYGSNKAVFSSYHLPSLYNSQQITGIFYTIPFVVFSMIPPLALLSVHFKRPPATLFANDNQDYSYSWIILAISVAFLSAFGFLTSFFWAAMRYMEDFMPSLIILSATGFWQGYQLLAGKPALRNYFISFGLALAIISIVISNLIAISINDLRFAFIK